MISGFRPRQPRELFSEGRSEFTPAIDAVGAHSSLQFIGNGLSRAIVAHVLFLGPLTNFFCMAESDWNGIPRASVHVNDSAVTVIHACAPSVIDRREAEFSEHVAQGRADNEEGDNEPHAVYVSILFTSKYTRSEILVSERLSRCNLLK